MIYVDKRGWAFRVMHGLGGVWKARYNKKGIDAATGWRGVNNLSYRENKEDAEHDLAEYAAKRDMKALK